jgi:ubiquinone/menaquinone biosynthesis C-methylase UbiE
VIRDRIRRRLLKYTRKAFRMIPEMERPLILDIGCGSGIPTQELVKLSRGKAIGIDIDQSALDRFAGRIKKAGLANQIQVMNCSMFDMDFPDKSFDIVWAEGSIYAIGFERGLRKWKQLLKPGGCMVVHDEQGNIKKKLEQISDCGYQLLGYFTLSKETWWTEYFAPLEKLVNETRSKYPYDRSVLEEIRQAQAELDMYRKYPERNSSVCVVMKRN